MGKLEQDFVWECDYGDRGPLVPVIKRILDEQPASQLQMAAMFVNNNPYGPELFLVFSYDDPAAGQMKAMMGMMSGAGARYRPDLTYHELFEEVGDGRFNMTTFLNSELLDIQFKHMFFHRERKDIAKRISMRPLGQKSPVFLSYATADEPEVEELSAYLNAVGMPVWFAKFNIDYGQSIVDAVQGGVATSRAVIFWVTKSFLASDWCKTEMRNFLSRYSGGHNVLMITVVGDEVGHEDLPLFLRDLKYLRREKGMTVAAVVREILPALKKHFVIK